MKPPKDLTLRDDWLWYVVKALNGTREWSKAFQEVVREMYTTCGWLDSLAGWHGDDFYGEGVSPAHWMRSTR